MPTLDFKGKSLVYAHHLSVPARTLEPDAKKSLPLKGSKPSLDDNLIIHGDNLHALKALMPRYAGKIKCIYIDPPYNTGNEGWIVQRQREQPNDAGMAERQKPGGRRRPGAPRQMALHDVATAEPPTRTAG